MIFLAVFCHYQCIRVFETIRIEEGLIVFLLNPSCVAFMAFLGSLIGSSFNALLSQCLYNAYLILAWPLVTALC